MEAGESGTDRFGNTWVKTDSPTETEGTFTFADKHGNEWALALDYGMIDQIKTELGHNLESTLEDDAALTRILFKDRTTGLIPILYTICEEQAQEAGIEKGQPWSSLFDGPTVERATKALIGALSTFLYGSRIGAAVREQTAKLTDAKEAKIVAQIQALTLDAAGHVVSPGNTPGAAGSRTFRRGRSANSKPLPKSANASGG